mgnify:CR=1 FL=1
MPRIPHFAALMLAVTAGAWAQQPPRLEPLPEPPPPPPGMELDSEIEPQVTIVRKGEDTVEEYRQNYMGVLNHPNQGALYRGMSLAYMWDNHDFSGDDSNGTAIGTATARTVYRDTVPHYPINVTGGTVAHVAPIDRPTSRLSDPLPAHRHGLIPRNHRPGSGN